MGETIPTPGEWPSPVLTAIYHGKTDLLSELVRGRALTVHEASAAGDVERLGAALDSASDAVNVHTPDGWTPLHLSAFFADASTVELLLSRGADVHAWSRNSTANQPLHAAIAGRSDPIVVRRLVEAGADVLAAAEGGWTPLHLAASRGSVALVEFLLERGGSADARSSDGRTPADVARERGHADAAERLDRAREERS